MKRNMTGAIALLAILGFVILGGCGTKSGTPKATKTGGVDENKSIADIKAEIAKMDQKQIREMALKYKTAVEAKTGDLTKLADKLKQIPLTEALGPETGKLKTELETITTSVAALTERLNVYVDKLKEMKVDTADLKP